MEYQLAEKNAPGNVVAVKDCADDFEAEEWAHAWTKANGKSDEYRLECSGGGFSALLLKTVGGQWYMMRRS